MKKIINIFSIFMLLIWATGSFAADNPELGSGVKDSKLVGSSYWATVSDDEVSGKKVIQSIVEISSDNGVVTGKVLIPFTKIVDEKAEVPSLICTKCKGNLKDKPVIGLQIINAKLANGNVYKGNIIDPTSGKDYTLKMWLSDNDMVLNVRGYIAFFYRTQNWYHVDGKVAKDCSVWFAKQTYAKNSSQAKGDKKLADDKYAFFGGGSDGASKGLMALCK